MRKKLIVATRNQGKIKEIKQILKGLSFALKTLDEVGFFAEIVEKGKTFVGNARFKARIVGLQTRCLTLAEDAGLEVDAISGRPGVYSARYTSGSDKDRVNKLLGELKGVPKEKRTAKFRCVVAVYDPQTGKTQTFTGESRGLITEKPTGTNGFGYDPIFFNLDLGKTNAEASMAEKNQVSHRAKALFKARDYLFNS